MASPSMATAPQPTAGHELASSAPIKAWADPVKKSTIPTKHRAASSDLRMIRESSCGRDSAVRQKLWMRPWIEAQRPAMPPASTVSTHQRRCSSVAPASSFELAVFGISRHLVRAQAWLQKAASAPLVSSLSPRAACSYLPQGDVGEPKLTPLLNRSSGLWSFGERTQTSPRSAGWLLGRSRDPIP